MDDDVGEVVVGSGAALGAAAGEGGDHHPVPGVEVLVFGEVRDVSAGALNWRPEKGKCVTMNDGVVSKKGNFYVGACNFRDCRKNDPQLLNALRPIHAPFFDMELPRPADGRATFSYDQRQCTILVGYDSFVIADYVAPWQPRSIVDT